MDLATGSSSLNDRLASIHRQLKGWLPAVTRVAIALYDASTDEIKTFLCSPLSSSPLTHYGWRLRDVPTLEAVRRARTGRIVPDTSIFADSPREHSRRILAAGFKSSYTVPMYDGESFSGFIFFDATETGFFTAAAIEQLDPFVQLISILVGNELRDLRVLSGGSHVLEHIAGLRSRETGTHLSRIAHYAHLAASRLAARFASDDAWVEHLRLLTPLHDIGKIAIPDGILMKPGPLTRDEYEVMKTHAARGVEIVDVLIGELALSQLPYVRMLKSIVLHHHEAWDGSGYPHGLAGEAIPIEARIVKVVDVFDALTSRRCYKDEWPLESVKAHLLSGAGAEFDPACVEAFLSQEAKIREIHARFADTRMEGAA